MPSSSTPLSSFQGGPALGVDSSGAVNVTLQDPGADNLVAITANDGSTVTSGYLQPFYTAITLDSDAAWSSSAQINAFAADITLDGTVNVETSGVYIYITSASAPTISSGQVNGYEVYIDDLKAAPSTRAGIQIHVADGNTASNQDAAMLVRLEGSSSTLTNLIQLAGTANKKPAYFLATNQGGAASSLIQSFTAAGTQDLVLVCNINGSTYWIPMYAASA